MAGPRKASQPRPLDEECPGPKGCRRTAGCVHGPRAVYAHVLSDPTSARWFSRDDAESGALLGLGLTDGQLVFELPIFGFRAWAGLVVRFWMVQADDEAPPRGHAAKWSYVEQFRLKQPDRQERTVYRIVRAEVRACSGTYGSPDYSEGSMLARVSLPLDGSPRWDIPLVGPRPDDPQLSRAYDVLEAARRRGRGRGSKSPDPTLGPRLDEILETWWVDHIDPPRKKWLAEQLGISDRQLRRESGRLELERRLRPPE